MQGKKIQNVAPGCLILENCTEIIIVYNMPLITLGICRMGSTKLRYKVP